MTGPPELEGLDVPVGGSFWHQVRASRLLAIGLVLACVHLILALGGGGWMLVASERHLASRDTVRWVGWLVGLSTVFLPLSALSLIMMGELGRRGMFSRARPGRRSRGFLAGGTNAVTFRLLGTRWHVMWLAVAAGVVVLLLALISTNRERLGGGGPVSGLLWLWFLNGVFAAGGLGAVAGSLVKKVLYRRHQDSAVAGARRTGPGADDPRTLLPVQRRWLEEAKGAAKGRSRLWRWVGYRWRFDTWACAFGVVALWCGAFFSIASGEFPSDAPGLTRATTVVLPVGAALLILGVVAAAQFWRSGEDLGAGESVT